MIGGMLLQSIPEPTEGQSWTLDVGFSSPPLQPVTVTICDGYEHESPLPFMNVPPVMSDQLYQALLAAGIQNIDVYEAELVSQDGQVRWPGFKAFNVIGIFENIHLVKDLRLFRLTSFTSEVIIHSSIRKAIEASGISGIRYRKPGEFSI